MESSRCGRVLEAPLYCLARSHKATEMKSANATADDTNGDPKMTHPHYSILQSASMTRGGPEIMRSSGWVDVDWGVAARRRVRRLRRG